jgi:alpha-maltose-1-phosphate synthase
MSEKAIPSSEQTANAAIYFVPEGYSTAGSKVLGRQAAGEGFLKSFLRHSEAPAFYCYAFTEHSAREFARLRDACGRKHVPVRWIGSGDIAALAQPGAIYLPGPSLKEMAWRRRRVGSGAFSLCGITHTIASHGAMDAIAESITAPVAAWDALICTSQAVRQSVQRLLAAESEYLVERLGARHIVHPQLPVIPLGTECDAYEPDAEARKAWRDRLGIGQEDVAFLFLGRLSFHAKANPVPMYFALERAAQRSARKLHFIQAGWFENAAIEAEFRDGARTLCPSVNPIFLDGRDPDVRRNAWQAADVFISLSDNIQETFGLTPVEAMAAGLPSVVSDWDGYRETVRDGIDGFLIPTLMPAAPAGTDLARRHEDEIDTYDRYIGYASLATGVDVPACTDACVALANDASLRRRMGDAARLRARAEFDWRVIIARYRALWHELALARRAAGTAAPEDANPRRPDPFGLFAQYPTRTLTPDDRVTLAPGAGRDHLAERYTALVTGFGKRSLPSEQACAALLDRLASKDLSVAEVLANAPPDAVPALLRGLVWLYKLDLVRVSASRADGVRH